MGSDTETLTPDYLMNWVQQNPDIVTEWLSMGLDVVADGLGRSQEARLARVIATRAWELHMLILGYDELELRNEESQEE